MKNEQVRRVLIIRLSSLGDIILTTPLIKLVQETFPIARIDYCTKAQYSYILKSNPYIHKVIKAKDELNKSSLEELRQLFKMSSYNIIIDAHNNLKTIYLRSFQNAEILVFRKYSLRKFLLVNFKINLMKELPPITERYRQVISGYTTQEKINEKTLPSVFTDEISERSISNMFTDLGIDDKKEIITIPAVSKHFTKTYPPEYYADVINNYPNAGAVFFLTGTGRDSKNINSIKSLVKDRTVYDLCNKLEIPDLISLIKRSTLVICGDTGPMHIAEALNIPLIMPAGSSVKEFGFYPQNEKSVVLENNSLKCRPCSHYGKEKCPKGHFKCMKEIKPEIILSKAAVI